MNQGVWKISGVPEFESYSRDTCLFLLFIWRSAGDYSLAFGATLWWQEQYHFFPKVFLGVGLEENWEHIFFYLKTVEQGPWFTLFKCIRHSHSGCQQIETYFWKVTQVTRLVHGKCIWGPKERYTPEKKVSETLLESQLHVCHVQNKTV